MHREYAVGYKNPPVEYRFKAGNPGGRQKADRRGELPDLASQLARPLQAERGGKSVKVHAYEAATLSLVKEALKGKPRALKKALQIFEEAGLLNPPAGKQTHGSLFIPKYLDQSFFLILLKIIGVPPWDPKICAAAKAEYEQDRVHIEELYKQLLSKGGHNG
jgi:hypothetical protein